MKARPSFRDRDGAEELDRFKREVNLSEYAASLGYQLDRRESSQASLTMRHPTTHDKIIVARSDDQHWTYFSVHDDRDNGTIVDFVANRRHPISLGGIRQELRRWLGILRPRTVADFVQMLPMRMHDRKSVQKAWNSAEAARNVPYLNSRGIRPETLALARFVGAFRVDGRGNVLFPHADADGVCGFEAKNVSWTAFSAGGQRVLWRSNVEPTDTQLVLTEGAIDALSYCQLHPDNRTRYASVGGGLGRQQLETIGDEIRRLPSTMGVIAAFDADAAGAKLAEAIASVAQGRGFIRAIPTAGKDWNDVLKRKERVYIAGLGKEPAGLEI